MPLITRKSAMADIAALPAGSDSPLLPPEASAVITAFTFARITSSWVPYSPGATRQSAGQ